MLLESFHLYYVLYVIFWFFRNCLHPLTKGLGKVLPKEGFSIMAMSFAMKYVIWLIITSLLLPLTPTQTNAHTIRTNSICIFMIIFDGISSNASHILMTPCPKLHFYVSLLFLDCATEGEGLIIYVSQLSWVFWALLKWLTYLYAYIIFQNLSINKNKKIIFQNPNTVDNY